MAFSRRSKFGKKKKIYGKRRRGNSRAGSFRKRVVQIVKRQLNPERSFFQVPTTGGFTTVPLTPTPLDLHVSPLVPQGTGIKERVGEKIEVTRIHVSFNLYAWKDTLPIYTSFGNRFQTRFRVIMVYFPLGEPATIGNNILQNGTSSTADLAYSSIYAQDPIAKYQILFDRKYNVEMHHGSSVATQPTNQKHSFWLNHKARVEYDKNTTTVLRGSYYMLAMVDNADVVSVGSQPHMDYRLVFKYTDV